MELFFWDHEAYCRFIWSSIQQITGLMDNCWLMFPCSNREASAIQMEAIAAHWLRFLPCARGWRLHLGMSGLTRNWDADLKRITGVGMCWHVVVTSWLIIFDCPREKRISQSGHDHRYKSSFVGLDLPNISWHLQCAGICCNKNARPHYPPSSSTCSVGSQDQGCHMQSSC